MLELLRGSPAAVPCVVTGDLVPLRFQGDDVLVVVDRHWDELNRRGALGLRAITQRRALRLLLSMPRGVAVPLDVFRPADRRLLRTVPAGVVEFHGTDVGVLLRPALSLLSVGVVSTTWKQGLRRSSPFAPYCARYVLLDGHRAGSDMTLATMEARFYGVGLAVHRDGMLDWLVAPAPFQRDRYTEASWLMAERMTEALAQRSA